MNTQLICLLEKGTNLSQIVIVYNQIISYKKQNTICVGNLL